MKKLILIAFFALVTLQVKAQKTTCVNVAEIEYKTWSNSLFKYVVTSTVDTRGEAVMCVVGDLVSFGHNDHIQTLKVHETVSVNRDGEYETTTYNMTNGATMVTTFKFTKPTYMVVTVAFSDLATTYSIPEQ
jgi:hypothetical protein